MTYKQTMAASTLSQWPFIQLKSLFLPHKTRYLNTTLIRRTSSVAVSVTASSSSSMRKDKNSLIVIDNYDSFTYNLCQLGCNFEVYRNDEITVDELRRYVCFSSLYLLCYGWHFVRK
ncbi:putative anthranilate synthase [Helianthus annuus]|nr:putative anthranilate synthase [Helianthus annuus]